MKDARKYGEELGAVFSGGINWDWFHFPVEDEEGEEKATKLNAWLETNGFETRGVYPPHNGRGYGVRYR